MTRRKRMTADEIKKARREYMREYMRRYRVAHRDEEVARVMDWQRRNKDRYNAYQRAYRAKMAARRKESEDV